MLESSFHQFPFAVKLRKEFVLSINPKNLRTKRVSERGDKIFDNRTTKFDLSSERLIIILNMYDTVRIILSAPAVLETSEEKSTILCSIACQYCLSNANLGFTK